MQRVNRVLTRRSEMRFEARRGLMFLGGEKRENGVKKCCETSKAHHMLTIKSPIPPMFLKRKKRGEATLHKIDFDVDDLLMRVNGF